MHILCLWVELVTKGRFHVGKTIVNSGVGWSFFIDYVCACVCVCVCVCDHA